MSVSVAQLRQDLEKQRPGASRHVDERDVLCKEAGLSEFMFGAERVETSLEWDPFQVGVGTEALLAATLLGTWTAFEAIATDLWVAAVNDRPMTLGVNAIMAPRSSGLESRRAGDADDVSSHSLSLDVLREFRFDLKNQIGTMLWRKRKFDFNTVSGVQQAYTAAFCERDKKGNNRGVHKDIKDAFSESAFADISVLEAIRHVLIHRGGMADKPFVERVKRHPHLSKIEERERIEVDGQMVRTYTSAVCAGAARLVRGLDAWFEREDAAN
jgi:hypothetical protein